MEQQKTFDWLKEVCDQALDEARGGNGALLQKIGNHGALSYYFNNVHTLHAITPEQYAEQAPGFVQAAEKFRVEYEALAAIPEDHNRLNVVESELTALKAMLTEALAALKSGAVPEPKKPAKPSADKVDKPTATEDESEA